MFLIVRQSPWLNLVAGCTKPDGHSTNDAAVGGEEVLVDSCRINVPQESVFGPILFVRYAANLIPLARPTTSSVCRWHADLRLLSFGLFGHFGAARLGTPGVDFRLDDV